MGGSSLRDAVVLCTVGAVFDHSPAASAGLLKGDEVLSFGPLHTEEAPAKGFRSRPQRHFDAITLYQGVKHSIGPLVAASLERPVDVVVRRSLASPDDVTVAAVAVGMEAVAEPGDALP